MVMLDPAVYDEVIVTVAHPSGDIETPLSTWIKIGPGPRRLVTISKARWRDGTPVPLEEIPLQYSNNAESRRLQRLGLLPEPWTAPPEEPPPPTWHNDRLDQTLDSGGDVALSERDSTADAVTVNALSR